MNNPENSIEHGSAVPDNHPTKIVLGLVGSPRKLGNCEIFTKEISLCLNLDHILKLVRMPSLNIMPCDACYRCITDRTCPHNDDMAFLLSEIAAADGIIITSPVYYLSAHSIYKRVLDRGFLFFSVLEKTYGKPCVLANMYGMEDRIGTAPHALMVLAACLGLDIKAGINVKAALPGEALISDEGKQMAKDLAEVLFSDKRIKKEDCCPFCGCEIVRMEQGKFICALCHGSFRSDSNGGITKIRDGGIFGTAEHMFEHKAWLRGMKDRFSRNRKDIIHTLAGYKDIGEWIRSRGDERQ